jgi:hypothetical protein
VLDFSQDNVEVTIERPRGLISHDLAAIKGHGRYQFLRDMPPIIGALITARGEGFDLAEASLNLPPQLPEKVQVL